MSEREAWLIEDEAAKAALRDAVAIEVLLDRTASSEGCHMRAIMHDGARVPIQCRGFDISVSAPPESKVGRLTVMHQDGSSTVWSEPWAFGRPSVEWKSEGPRIAGSLYV